MTIAALFVATNGVYFNLPDVEPWDITRDVRLYPGPHPVIAHPPCERWGRYWHGGPSAKVRRVKGDDDGCFASALSSVRRWGGVLEHPAHSAAWAAHGIFRPPSAGGWIAADVDGVGFTCHVEQGHYGHRARKATWLYAVPVSLDVPLPTLVWGPSSSVRLDYGYHSAEERRLATRHRGDPIERMGKRERTATPIPFRDLLLTLTKGPTP